VSESKTCSTAVDVQRTWLAQFRPTSLQAPVEILMGNFASAIIHGRMLRTLFEKQSEIGKLDLAMLRAVLYNDGGRSPSAQIQPLESSSTADQGTQPIYFV
jgi:hypothetical protein